jgi:hypothetical protein
VPKEICFASVHVHIRLKPMFLLFCPCETHGDPLPLSTEPHPTAKTHSTGRRQAAFSRIKDIAGHDPLLGSPTSGNSPHKGSSGCRLLVFPLVGCVWGRWAVALHCCRMKQAAAHDGRLWRTTWGALYGLLVGFSVGAGVFAVVYQWPPHKGAVGGKGRRRMR